MIKMERLFRKGFLSSVLAASLILGGVPLNGFLTPVFGKTPDKTITGLGTGAIGDPVAPEDVNSYWKGSYVYYGKYYRENIETAEPVKYRVLDSAATEFGGNTLFLDCDAKLYNASFDRDRTPNPGAQKANEWAYSDVKKGLIGDDFLKKDGCFTGPEKKAIAESTVGTHTVTVGSPDNRFNIIFTDYTELNRDTVFLLDVGDVLNPAYGYSSDSGIDMNHFGTVECRKKSGKPGGCDGWWLRSSANNNDIGAGGVHPLGFVFAVDVKNPDSGGAVSPAFNVNLSSIIFTSLISGTAGEPGAEYKLTLKDDNMNIAVTDGKAVTRKDDTVTVPYTITTGTNAGNATQVSVLVTDKPYEAGKAVTSGFYYKKLNVGSWNTSGTGTFDIPNTYRDKIWGKDYHVYILAEDVNGEKETDYASKPEEIHIHTLKHYDRKEPSDTSEGNIEYWECLGCGELFSDAEGTQVVSKKDTVIPKSKKISATVTGFSGTYDGKAHGITVKVTDPSSGAAVRYGTVAGTCDKTTSPEYTEVGTYTVYYKVTAEGYSALTGQAVIEIKDKKEDRSDLDDPGKKDDPGKDEKPVIPIPADNIVIDIPEDSPVERDSVTGEDFVNDVGESLAEAAESLGKKEGESSDLYVEFNKELSDEEITNYLNRPEKLTISVNSVSSDSLDSDASKEGAAEEAGLKLADPKAMTPSVEIKIDIYSDDGVHVGTVKKLDRGIDLSIDVSGFTEEVISLAKSFLIMSRHTPAEKWFIAGVGILDPETMTVRKTVREFSEFAVAADSREVVGIEAEDGLKADKGALDSEIEKLVKDSVKAYRLLKDGSIEYDVPGEVYLWMRRWSPDGRFHRRQWPYPLP